MVEKHARFEPLVSYKRFLIKKKYVCKDVGGSKPVLFAKNLINCRAHIKLLKYRVYSLYVGDWGRAALKTPVFTIVHSFWVADINILKQNMAVHSFWVENYKNHHIITEKNHFGLYYSPDMFN